MTSVPLPELLRDDALRTLVLGASYAFDASLPLEAAERLQLWQTARGVTVGTPAQPTWSMALECAIADEIFALSHTQTADEMRQRLNSMAVRAQARLNAQAVSAPTALRHRAAAQDVSIQSLRQPYARFFSVEEYDLTHRTFRGGVSETLTRAAFVSGDAVVVLPYDPKRDRVLLIEQFRAGPVSRGDSQPWSLETVAGRIDPGETPEQAARREAVEEGGVVLDHLEFLGGTYPSPGAVSEYLYNYVAIADLPDTLDRHGGLETEGEDIRIHLMRFDEMLALIDTGEINNGPLITIALQWDRRRRAG